MKTRGFFKKNYEIHDEHGLVLRGEKIGFFGLGDYDLYNVKDEKVLEIRKRFHLYKYYLDFKFSGEILGSLSNNSYSNSYILDYENHEIILDGNFVHSKFTLMDQNTEIGKITRKRWGREFPYHFAFRSDYNQLFLLASVICLSIVSRSKKQKS